MDSLFGLSMNILLVVMLALLALSLVTVVVVALRQRIMFLIGLRNIPRRVAQTTLIILGLMLSTLIISAAFTTGDTVDRSITNEVYRILGHVDEVIDTDQEGDTPAPDVSIPQSTFEELDRRVAGDPNIDGLLPVIVEEVPVVARLDDPQSRLSSPQALFVGLDPAELEAFPDLTDTDGTRLDFRSLRDDEVYINDSLADEVNAQVGDRVTVFYQNRPIEFTVKAIAEDRAINGHRGGDQSDGLVTRLSSLQQLLGREGELDFIAVSNTGGVRDSVSRTDAVVARLERVIDEGNLRVGVEPFKQDGVEQAELAGNGLMTFFLVFGAFSIAAGILLIVMIFVMLAAERKSEMGMARALGTKRWHLIETFLAEGMGYNVVSALVGTALGVGVAFAFAGILASLFAGSDFSLAIEPYASPRSLAIAYSLGVVLTFITVAFSSWRVSRLNIVRAVRDLPEPEGKPGRRSIIAATVVGVIAALFILLGFASGYTFPYALGVSLASFAAAVFARWLGLPDRPVFTTMGLFLLVFWVLSAGQRIPGPSQGDIEMFILSGIVMVAAASYVLVYNADLLLAGLTFAGGRLGRLLPAVRMAVAYPLASKFRTGMTLAMIAIVVFALTMMSVMNSNFGRLFLSEKSMGGWDVEVRENPNNPLPNGLEAALGEGDRPVDTSGFEAVGSLGVARPFGAELCQPAESDGGCSSPDDFKVYNVKGADEPFFQHNVLPLQARATGYETDRAVWEALGGNPRLAVIDVNALGGGFGPFGGMADIFKVKGLDAEVSSFEPLELEVRDSGTGRTGTVTLIGILELGASGDPFSSFGGLITTRAIIDDVFGSADFSTYFVRLRNEDVAVDVARDVESALYTNGVQASSLLKDRQDEQRLFNGFFYLMQAFAGLGLVVGVAAVGVIAFRSIVERRQQIGMLRAIGYTRGTVATSFLLESSFVTLLGVSAGIGLAILLSYFLLTSDEFSSTGIRSVYIPWDRVAAVGVFAVVASLVMTFIPSRQAASIPIAEALRYE